MSSTHCVVVWEYQSNGQWLPHTPGVARTLERAHAKKLTRVVLADADPALNGYYVNLRTLTQSCDTPEGGTVECAVRRQCYGVQSACGRGARWEWARLAEPHDPLHYRLMNMEMQCALEEAWRAGADSVEAGGWLVSVARGTARRGAALRLVRRAAQPPYPRARADPQPPQVPVRRIPQQHTGSSVHSVQSTLSNLSTHSNVSAHSNISAHSNLSGHSAHSASTSVAVSHPRAGARSASPKDRKPGLARQILHNLNIFSNNNKQSSESESTSTACDTDTSQSTRRHSVDTVSTYLSNHSLQRGSVGELLNCSSSSDDVFEASNNNDVVSDTEQHYDEAECSATLPGWVRGVSCPQWGAVCPVCLQPLGTQGARVLSLALCQHMLHLHCLRAELRNRDPAYIECLVCGESYGTSAAAPEPAAHCQPAGSMSWYLQHGTIPGLDCASILVTYNFQSGRQVSGQPAPGAPYYAVGFPRHSLLPDNTLGRQVLSALREAWERGRLFTISASVTTGREWVVTWCAPPPPACAAHYTAHTVHDTLHAALQRLHLLLHHY